MMDVIQFVHNALRSPARLPYWVVQTIKLSIRPTFLSVLFSLSSSSTDSLMEVVSDTRSELVVEAGCPNYELILGMTEVQCLIPELTALVLASQRDFFNFL